MKEKLTEQEMYAYLEAHDGMMHDDETIAEAYMREHLCQTVHGGSRTKLAREFEELKRQLNSDD